MRRLRLGSPHAAYSEPFLWSVSSLSAIAQLPPLAATADTQRPFAPAACDHRRHRSYGLMRQPRSRTPAFQSYPSTAGLPRHGNRGWGQGLPCFASQSLQPCCRPYAGESLGHLRPTFGPGCRLHLFVRGSALPLLATVFTRGFPYDAAAIPSCCGPVARSPPWTVPSCDGGDLFPGAFARAVTQPRRPVCYAVVRLLPRPDLHWLD